MATKLPPIVKKKNVPRKKSLSTSSGIDKRPRRGHLDKMSYAMCHDLLAKLPVLQKLAIEKFRNSYKHNLCLDMLTKGFHMSFCELITLIRQQMERREVAGPESFLWTKPVLQDQKLKLDLLMLYMTKAENAYREGNISDEYMARFELAKSFSNDPDDQWLADHFFDTCLDVAKRENKMDTKMLAEGLSNVGLCLQKNMYYKEAAKHFESYHKLALNHKLDWMMPNGGSFYIDSCTKLYHIYTIIGMEISKCGEEEDNEASLQMLIQALEMAKNSENRKLEGEASFNLGLAYQKVNQLDNAQVNMFNFYESCHVDGNSECTGQACDAIAKIYARQGNKEKSVEFLKRFVELTEKTGLEKEYCLACYNLGNVCNSVGNYDEATEYFSKAYNISSTLSDTHSANINRVQYGIAVAHRMMGKYVNHVVIPHPICTFRLLNWKCVKRDDFDKHIPDTDPGAAIHLLIPPPCVKEKDIINEEEGTEGDDFDLVIRDEDVDQLKTTGFDATL